MWFRRLQPNAIRETITPQIRQPGITFVALTKDDIETHERIARVEEILSAHVEQEGGQLEALAAKMDSIELELSRYRGFVGGILLVITAVVTFVKLFGEQIIASLKG
jgi:hypothetical protein